MFTHIVLQSKFLEQDIINPKNTVKKKNKLKTFKKTSYLFLLKQLKSWILKLKFKKEASTWGLYEKFNTYEEKSLSEKEKIVEQFTKKYKPKTLIDLGCNNGKFSKIALDNDATVDAVKISDNFINNGIEVKMMEFKEKDPSETGFETLLYLINRTRQTKFSDLMRLKLNGKTKRHLEI